MRTTRAHFETFKRSFLYWQKELGMLDYKVVFEHVNLNRNFALIGVDHHAKAATVSMTTQLRPDAACPAAQLDPELSGKHEAIHLFLSRGFSLAFSRFVLERELYDTEEGMVRVLEKVLRN